MKYLFLACLALVALLLAGCESVRVVLRPAQTNDIAIRVTNSVPELASVERVSTSLNPIAGGPEIRTTNVTVVTNFVQAIEEKVIRVVIPEVAYTNVTLSPIVSMGVQTAGAVAPVPWAGTAATAVIGVLGSVFGLVSERRRRAALGEKETWKDTASVLVDNVETIRKAALTIPGYTPQIDKQVIRGIQLAQSAAGIEVKDRIHRLVEDQTTPTVP